MKDDKGGTRPYQLLEERKNIGGTMQKRTLGKGNLDVSAIGARLYGNELWLRSGFRHTGDDHTNSYSR